MRNTILMFIMLCMTCFTGLNAADFNLQDKMYIDPESFNVNTSGDEFYVHIGENIWLVTHTINRDEFGVFAYEHNLRKSTNGPGSEMSFEKKWRCPYCHRYWPIGKPCGNDECPSKYK